MTYSLFEYAKENLETLLVNQPEAVEVVSDTKNICDTLKNTTIRGMLITFSNTNKSGLKSEIAFKRLRFPRYHIHPFKLQNQLQLKRLSRKNN